jgi:hypothetical protein
MKRPNQKAMYTISQIIAFGLLIVCISMPASATSDSSDIVTLDHAEEVAEYYVHYIPTFISDLSKWDDATVEYSMTFYDPDGNKSAYSFDVIDNGDYAGYILVSATRNNYPILEFSEGTLPNTLGEALSKSSSEVNEYAEENDLTVSDTKPLYLGGTFYYVEYSLTNSTEKVSETLLLDLVTSQTISLEESESFAVTSADSIDSKLLEQKKSEANELWSSLEEEMSFRGIVSSNMRSSRSVSGIPGVPYYDQVRGCSPTAAGIVLGYWEDNGYSSLPDGDPLIEELADAMNTDSNGNTYTRNIDDGIEDVCSDYNYNNFDASNDYYLSWSEVKSEINADRPFMINMQNGGQASGRNQEYGDHSVACFGYVDSSTDYVVLHDGWSGTSNHYLTFGNWLSAVATWVRP